MQNQFLVALAIIVILGGGFLLWQNYASAPASPSPSPSSPTPTPTPPSPTPSATAPVTIAYTDAGFSPSSIIINRGQTVRFVNNSSAQDTWPASAVHPTHGVYPEKAATDCLGSSFDACRGLKPAESWSFTFNTAGEWRYHDHLHPSKTGVVNVVN